MTNALTQSPKTTLKQIRERASYDRDLAYEILDEGLLCHVGFTVDKEVFVVPMSYARDVDNLLLHGSIASRMLKTLANGLDICVSVTHLDGLVLARSVFSHSMNYRSLMIFGKAELVLDSNEKMLALKKFTDQILPGRWDDARQPTEKELAATSVLTMPIQEASIKTRSGPPSDLKKDLDLPVWAGVLPIQSCIQAPIADPAQSQNTPLPDYMEKQLT